MIVLVVLFRDTDIVFPATLFPCTATVKVRSYHDMSNVKEYNEADGAMSALSVSDAALAISEKCREGKSRHFLAR